MLQNFSCSGDKSRQCSSSLSKLGYKDRLFDNVDSCINQIKERVSEFPSPFKNELLKNKIIITFHRST